MIKSSTGTVGTLLQPSSLAWVMVLDIQRNGGTWVHFAGRADWSYQRLRSWRERTRNEGYL